MGRRSRERAREAAAPAPREPGPKPGPAPQPGAEPTEAEKMAAAYSRSRAKDEAARAALVPLAPGERPGAVTVAAVVAVLLAVANLVALALGESFEGGAVVASIGLSLVLLVAAWGLWHARYWAVLGFQALLTIQVIYFSLALIAATNLGWALLCVVAIALGGWLFVKLVRAMARIQMPAR
jgi:hypothetical protein